MKHCMALGLILALACTALGETGEGGGNGPAVTREEVKSVLEGHRASWEEKISAPRPRLYFPGGAEIFAKWKASDGQARKLFNAAVERASQIAAAPVTEYIAPEAQTKLDPNYARQELWQRDVGDNIVALTFASVAEPDPLLDQRLHDQVIAACKYPTWGKVGPNIDLACAHLARAIALAWDWQPDLWTPEDRELIKATIRDRVNTLLRGNYGTVAWSHEYGANHHHVAMAALGLCGLSFYNDIPEAPEWLAASIATLQNTFRYANKDGSSTEGVPYWSYSASYLLQLIEGIRPFVNAEEFYNAEMFRNAAAYRLNASVPGLSGIVPWGDATERDFYGPQHVLYRLAGQYRDGGAQWLAEALPFAPQGPADVPVWTFLWYDPSVAPSPSHSLDHVQETGGVATMRSGWTEGDTLLSIKSGYTNRNHTHLDAGAIALAIGDEWLLTTPGYGEGRHQADFWKIDGKRWDFQSNATESHSTLLVNGRNQRFDMQARAVIPRFTSGLGWAWTDVDMREAYQDVSDIRRSVLHRRGEYFLTWDAVTAAGEAPARVEWLAQAGGAAKADGRTLSISGENGTVTLEVLRPAETGFAPRTPSSPIRDVPPKKLTTYAAAAEGRQVDFLVFGSITRSAAPHQALIATVLPPEEPKENDVSWWRKLFGAEPKAEKPVSASRVAVQGPGWTDTVTYAREPVRIVLDPGSEAMAERAVTRTGANGLDSALLISATSLAVGGIRGDFTQPGDLEIQKVPEGWILKAITPLAGRLALPTGLRMVAEGGSERTGDEPTIPAGMYALAADSASAAKSLAGLRKTAQSTGRYEIAAPTEQAPLAESVRITKQAEDFDREGKGRVEIVEKPGADGGKCVRGFGSTSSRHFLGWSMPVAQAGRYVLAVRYCTAATGARATVLIDGKAVSPSAISAPLPPTGGWSTSQSDWKDHVITGEDGRPLYLDLTEGDQEIVLADPAAALNIDSIELRGAGNAEEQVHGTH